MKLSASKWLGVLGVLSSSDDSQLSKRDCTDWTSATTLVPATSASPEYAITTIPVIVSTMAPIYETTATVSVIVVPSADTTTTSVPVTATTSFPDTNTTLISATATTTTPETATSSASDTTATPTRTTTTASESVNTTPIVSDASTPVSKATTTSVSATTPGSGTTSDSAMTNPDSGTVQPAATTSASVITSAVATSFDFSTTSEGSASTLTNSTNTSWLDLFTAPVGIFTLLPGSQTLVVSVGSAVVQETGSMTTFITTLTNTALYLETEGPVISYSDVLNMPGATLYVEGDPSMVVSQTATVATTASVLTSISCTQSVCSPTPTAMPYTCGIVDGSTQLVTTMMQSYHCTTGQTCEGAPVETVLTCDCGGPICTTAVPLLPLVPVVIPAGAPIPPTIPKLPLVPKPPTFPWPPVVPLLPINPVPPAVPEPTPEPEPVTSENTSTDRSTISSEYSQSSDTSTYSATTSSSSCSSSTSACSYEDFSIPNDFESTLSAWMSQYPIMLTPYASTTVQTTSSSSLVPPTSTTSSPSSFITSLSSAISPTPSPTPTPTATSTTMATSTSVSCDAACSSSSASSAFEAGLSKSMAAGHSSVNQAFASAISAQSASISSASSAQAISTCQHYTLGYPWNPPDIPASLALYNGQSQYGDWMCVVDPNKIDTNQEWNSTWEYQPFAVDQGWDTYHPQDTLVDTFCNYLVNEKADVTPDGAVQGVCQAYDRGQCLNSVSSGQCMEWQHPWTTLDFSGPVMISVAYDSNCPMNEKPKPVDFGAVGAQGCKNSLQALVENCSFLPTERNNWAERNDVVGGTIWSNCMVYTIVGIKADDKPNPIWQS